MKKLKKLSYKFIIKLKHEHKWQLKKYEILIKKINIKILKYSFI